MLVSGRVRFTNWFEQVDLGASSFCPKVTLGTVASQRSLSLPAPAGLRASPVVVLGT